MCCVCFYDFSHGSSPNNLFMSSRWVFSVWKSQYICASYQYNRSGDSGIITTRNDNDSACFDID